MVLKRCVDVFLQALGSKKTHKNYLFQLDKFMVWNKLTDYDDNYQVHYKQTLRERKEVRESKRPDLYAKTTNNQSILCFVN